MMAWMVGLISRGMCLLDRILRRARFLRAAFDFDFCDITNGLLEYGETPVSVGRIATDRGHHWLSINIYASIWAGCLMTNGDYPLTVGLSRGNPRIGCRFLISRPANGNSKRCFLR